LPDEIYKIDSNDKFILDKDNNKIPDEKPNTKNNFDRIISKRIKYNDILNSDDFIFNSDVSSLYPSSMKGTELIKVAFPEGVSRWSNTPELEFNNNKSGFYEVEITPKDNINYPVTSNRLKNGGLQWNLLQSTGVYTFPDIEDAISEGYQVKFLNKCLVNDNTRDDFFTGYIEMWYKIKSDEDLKPENERNEARRNIAKLFMNALYGKMLQRANFEKEIIVNNTKQLYDFLKDHELDDINIIDNNKLIIKGISKIENIDDQITKPPQLGAYILAYSRRLMLFYNKKLDQSLSSLNVTYTDTDSMHIFGKDYKRLKEQNLIRSGELGFLSNDIKKDGLIIFERNLGTKLYMYKYIDNKNEIKTTMKAKGLPKKYLKQKFFLEEQGEVTIKDSFKKVFTKQTNTDIKNDIGIFTIRKEDIKRKFNLNSWSGRILEDNIYYPIGYNGPKLTPCI
jgi:hypothetical protein